jgi:peptide/nickel transport system permease protein
MGAYVTRRLLLMIPTILLVTIIVFAIVRLVPGSIIDLMVAQMPAEAGVKAEKITADYIRHELGLDQPLYAQYGHWISGVVRGDFGKSLWTDRPVTTYIGERVAISSELGVMALMIALLIAIPIGVYSAARQDTAGDYVSRTFAILGISLPGFWIGTIVIVFPSVWWGWSPPVQYIPIAQDVGGNLLQFILPAAIMGMAMSGTTMRLTRTMMLEVLRQDYIRTAWSKGLAERVVIVRHAMKNALIPVVSIVGLLLPVTVAGSVVMETIFSLPGIGQLLIQAINTRDYPIISGLNLVLASFILLINLGVDMSYGLLDPRIRYS